jgi:formiminotetrahydrofolate cyclodeaminase
MVARLTLGKKKFAAVSDEMSALVLRAEQARTDLTRRIDLDAAAFDGVLAARGLPKDTPSQQEHRNAQISLANAHASLVPLQTMKDSLAALECAAVAARTGNPNCVTDAGVAALFAASAVEGAWLNVAVNLGGLADPGQSADIRSQGEGLLQRAHRLRDEVLAQVYEKIHAPVR